MEGQSGQGLGLGFGRSHPGWFQHPPGPDLPSGPPSSFLPQAQNRLHSYFLRPSPAHVPPCPDQHKLTVSWLRSGADVRWLSFPLSSH